jgi:hypothetical protein
MAENKTIQLDVETNLGSLRTQLKNAQAEVAILSEKFGATSTEAANAARKAAELKDRIADAKALTDAFNPDAKFNALSTSIGGVLNGFQAFEGALGVMGVESEDLQKTLLKVQSAMALSQGLQGVMEAKDSFIQLGSVVKNSFAAMTAAGRAFALTGIGLVVTAIGGLIYAYQTMNDEAEQAANQQKALDKSIQATTDSIEQQQERLDSLSTIYDNNTRRDIINAKKRGASEEELTRIAIKGQKDRLNGLEEEVKQAENRYLYLSRTGTTKQFEAAEETYLKLQKEFTDLKLSIDEKEADILFEKRKKKIEENEEKLKNARYVKQLSQEEIEAIWTQQLIEEDNKRAEAKKAALEEQKQDEENYNKWRWNSYFETTKIEEEQAEKRKQLEKDVINSKIQIAQDSLALISNITSLFGQRNEKEAKKAFQIDKAAKLASATISGIEGTINAYTTAQKSPITALFPAYPAIQAGLAGAFAAVNIAKISQTQFQGGNNNIDSSNAPMGGASQSMTPQFNVVGGNQTSQLLQGLSMQPLKAYVVASDITTAQMLEQKAIKTSVL